MPGAPPVRSWLLLLALSLPIFALSIDANGVVVLLPTMARDLGVSPVASSAVVTVASVAFAAPLILIGRVATRFGPRPVLFVGVAGFGLSSLICALAGDYWMLMGGRVLQGLASACCFATSLAAINAAFDAERLPVAIGIWGAVGGIGSAAGPLVASLIGSTWSWRWFFGVNLVILVITLVMLPFLTPELPTDRTERFPAGRLGVLTVGVWVAFSALQRAGSWGWGHAEVWAGLVGGAVLVVVALRSRGAPIAHREVTRDPSFRRGTAEATLSNWGSGVLMVLVPIALQTSRGLGVVATGLVFLGFSVPFAVGGAGSGPGTRRRGAASTLATGSALLALGLVGLAVTGIDAPLGVVVVALAVAGFGNGLVYAASTAHGLAGVTTVRAAEASALLNMWRVLGLALAVGISDSIVRIVDSGEGARADAGLRWALLVAAAICVIGVPIVRRDPSASRTVTGTPPPAR